MGFCAEQDIYVPLPDNTLEWKLNPAHTSSGATSLYQQWSLGLPARGPSPLSPEPLWCPSVESVCTFKWPGQSLDPKPAPRNHAGAVPGHKGEVHTLILAISGSLVFWNCSGGRRLSQVTKVSWS